MDDLKNITLDELLLGPNYIIEEIKANENEIHLYIKPKNRVGVCPKCGKESEKVTASYNRKIQDLPIRGKSVILHVTSYKFRCQNPECSQKVFTQDLDFVQKGKTRTDELDVFILTLSVFMSSVETSQILSLLSVDVSATTVRNILDEVDLPDNSEIEEVGIDDVSIRKGKTYDTVVYDLTDHSFVDIFEGRDKESVTKWLEEHTNIETACRDRASSYANALKEVLPDCVQIADRFHLMKNLSDHLEKILKRNLPKDLFIKDDQLLEKTPNKQNCLKPVDLSDLDYDFSPPEEDFDRRPYNPHHKSYAEGEETRKRRYQRIQEARAYYNSLEDKSINAVAKKFGISWETASKYIKMTEAEVEKVLEPTPKNRKSKIDGWDNIIYKMLKDGYSYEVIANYIYLNPEFHKSLDYLCVYINSIAINNFGRQDTVITANLYTQKLPDDIVSLSRNEVIKQALMLDDKKKDEEKQKALRIIEKSYPKLAWVSAIYLWFHELLKEGEKKDLEIFLTYLKDSDLKNFVKSIKKDIDAVQHAMSSKYNSGFVEGLNNKFKLIKRIVYGKCKIVNLRKKCYLAFNLKLGIDMKFLLNKAR